MAETRITRNAFTGYYRVEVKRPIPGEIDGNAAWVPFNGDTFTVLELAQTHATQVARALDEEIKRNTWVPIDVNG